MIFSGTVADVNKNSGHWVFVDLGFSEKGKTCGLLFHDEQNPREITFSDMLHDVGKFLSIQKTTTNLLLEAPLSVAFNKKGNPTGRCVEEHPAFTSRRYWYTGLGCITMVAATHLLRHVFSLELDSDVRLFEGFASFKPKGQKSSHAKDVLGLRDIAWSSSTKGRIVAPDSLHRQPQDRLESAFKVSGMDFGVPPVILLDCSQ